VTLSVIHVRFIVCTERTGFDESLLGHGSLNPEYPSGEPYCIIFFIFLSRDGVTIDGV
jgi:hypothetical protein